MGQSIVVTEKPSSNRGVVRFETNRALTGMGHERYVAGEEVWGERPPDELARRLLREESVAGVQINGNMVTVDLHKGYDTAGLAEIIENLYRFYPDAPAAADDPAAAAEAASPAAEPAAEDEAGDPTAEEPAVEPAPADAAGAEAPADETAPVEAEPAAAAEAPPADEPPAEEPPVEEPPAAEAPAEETPAEEPAAET